jgi:murein DD-endopeptidase MepM/ murein hydrolase activator NlpD
MMTGFLKNSNGQVRYFHSRTGIMATGFVKNSSGKYRYFDSKTGIMATGLVRNSNGLYRYFNPKNGIMETGWVVNKEGKYRYFSPKNGIMITGWHENTNGQKRYFDAKTGIMQTGWVKNSQGKYRYFSPNGGWMQTGMVTISGNRYYFDSNGLRMSGWITYNDNMYYFDPTTGIMAVSCWIDSTHYVGASGAYIPEYSSQDFRWPLDSQWNTLSSYFGNRTSPGGIGSTNHQGIDIPATLNTPVYAIADGIVTGKQTEAESGGAGNYLTISHGGTIVSEYMHLNRFAAIKVGDSVKKGQIIGYVGSTGNSTGPHLHLGIIING